MIYQKGESHLDIKQMPNGVLGFHLAIVKK